jgi:polyphosphate kinase
MPTTLRSGSARARLAYEMELKKLQIELMKLQQDMKKNGTRVLAIFEGRDAAGKGGTIKRITAFLNPATPESWPWPRPATRK